MQVRFYKTLHQSILKFISSKRQNWSQEYSASTGVTILRRQRIFILPTRFGWTFAVMLVAMLVGSINYASSLGFMMTFLLAAMGLVSVLHTHLNLLKLKIRFRNAEPVFAGGIAKYPCYLEDTLGRARYAIEVHHHLDCTLNNVPAKDQMPVQINVTSLQRGVLKLNLVRVETCYPLGLFRTWTYIMPLAECIIYPAPLALRPLPINRGGNIGERSSALSGGDDFLGLRDYRPGDSPRHIHWQALARGQNVQTKQFGQINNTELWLDWSSLTDFPPETRLGILCYWVIEADYIGVPYGLRLPSNNLTPGIGQAHKQLCLQTLALAR